MAHRAATDEICVTGGMGNAPSSKRRGLVRASACCLLAPKDLACQLRVLLCKAAPLKKDPGDFDILVFFY